MRALLLVVTFVLGSTAQVMAQDAGVAPLEPETGDGVDEEPNPEPSTPTDETPAPDPEETPAEPPAPTEPPDALTPVPPPPTARPYVPAPLDPERPGDEPQDTDVRARDSAVDRVIAISTAETQPAGTFYFNDAELAIIQVGYALSDRVQVSLTGLPPTFEEVPFFVDLSIKVNVARGSIGRVALLGALDVVFDENEDAFVGGRLGAIGQLCIVADCMSHVTFALGTFLNDRLDEAFPWTFSTGLVVHLSDLVALLLEPTLIHVFGDVFRDDERDLFTLGYGVRFTGRNWAFDVSLVRPFIDDIGDNPLLIMGVPWLGLTIRTDPIGPTL